MYRCSTSERGVRNILGSSRNGNLYLRELINSSTFSNCAIPTTTSTCGKDQTKTAADSHTIIKQIGECHHLNMVACTAKHHQPSTQSKATRLATGRNLAFSFFFQQYIAKHSYAPNPGRYGSLRSAKAHQQSSNFHCSVGIQSYP